MHIGDIIVGDIVAIKPGMDIPVDGLILRSSGVLVNESAMTGESDELKKDSFEACNSKLKEKKEELGNGKKAGPHDVTSPVLLSGT